MITKKVMKSRTRTYYGRGYKQDMFINYNTSGINHSKIGQLHHIKIIYSEG